MNTRSTDDDREERILMEIVVDAYEMVERAMGWFYYLADKITFPFIAECFIIDTRSPLIIGEKVTVSKMANEDNLGESEDMYVEISWNNRMFSVPLTQLKPLNANNDTIEAVED